MLNSVAIEQWLGDSIDGTVHLKEDGTLLVLTRDERGAQQSTVFNPHEHERSFAVFVQLPVCTANGKRKWGDINLKHLFRTAFPDKPLPAILQTSVSAQKDANQPLNEDQQLDLF